MLRSAGLQVVPLEQLHHEVRRPIRERIDIEDPRDPLALDLHRGAAFAQEAHHHVGALALLREQEFHGHHVVEVDASRGHHHAHAATPDHTLDAVLARKLISRGELALHEPPG